MLAQQQRPHGDDDSHSLLASLSRADETLYSALLSRLKSGCPSSRVTLPLTRSDFLSAPSSSPTPSSRPPSLQWLSKGRRLTSTRSSTVF